MHISPGIPKPIPRAKNRESAALKQSRDSVASNDSFNEPPLPLNPASAQQLAKVAAETEMLALFSTRYSMSNGWKMMVISSLQEEHCRRSRGKGGRDRGVQEGRR